MSNLLPIYDDEIKTFREPYIPNEKIGIIHLAGGIWINNSDMRLNKELKIKMRTLNGKYIEKSLRFES